MKYLGSWTKTLRWMLFLVGFSCLTHASVMAADLQQFHPTTNGLGLLGVEGYRTLEPLQPAAGLSFNYARALLTFYPVDDDPIGVSAYQFVGDFHAGIGLLDRFDVGLAFPVVLSQGGIAPGDGEGDLPSMATGDLRIVGRVQVLDPEKAPVGMAFVLPVMLPTGDESAYAGEEGLVFHPQVAVGRGVGPVDGWIDVGYRQRPKAVLDYDFSASPLILDSELTIGLVASVSPLPLLTVGTEVEARLGLGESSASLPVEARVVGKFRVLPGLEAYTAFGMGLSSGYGTPAFRGVAGVSWRLAAGLPAAKKPKAEEPEEPVAPVVPLDRDKDGIPDEQDRCPTLPEMFNDLEDDDGCPEPDGDYDGIADALDQCPIEPEDLDGFQDADGCPEVDNDEDGLLDGVDHCPNEAEDLDQYQDSDGCPDPDNDGDGIPDRQDKCPDQPEVKNGFLDDDGCPEADRDADGVLDDDDRCPDQPESRNGYRDDDGCPEVDQDGDGRPDAVDRCPKQAETLNGFEDDDGCPDERPEGTSSEGGGDSGVAGEASGGESASTR